MIPPKRKVDYEKVPLGEFVKGVIKDIEYNMEHKSTWKGQEKVGPAVRLVFELELCKFPHKTRWMTFSYGEKTNLYIKYLSKLVEGAKPDMAFDLDQLKGLRVKTIWAEENDFQFVESIFPQDKKIVPEVAPHEEEMPPEPETEHVGDEEAPF